MIQNRRGFVIEGAMVLWAIVALCITGTAIIAGPKLVQAVKGSNQNVVKQSHKLQESGPVIYRAGIDKTGEAIYKPAGNWNKKEEFINISKEVPPETWMQKFFGLGLYAILICVILGGIVTGLGAWPLVNSIRAKLKAKLEQAAKDLDVAVQEREILNADAKQIVQSVDAGWGVIKETIEINKQLSIASTDPSLKLLYQSKADVLDLALKDMKKEMDRVQDTETYNLVRELMKND